MLQKKRIIDLQVDHDAFFEDAVLLGLACPMPVFRIAHLLNTRLNLHMRPNLELDIFTQNKKNEKKYFLVYECSAGHTGTRHILYQLWSDDRDSNSHDSKQAAPSLYDLKREERTHLLPEIKKLDFIWMIQGDDFDCEADFYLEYLKRMREVLHAQIIRPGQLQHRSNLIL